MSALATITREHRAHETRLPVALRRTLKSEKVLSEYRVWLFGQGEEVRDGDAAGSRVVRKGVRREVVEQVRGQSGKLTLAETLRYRVTYFTAGVALGRRSFVDSFFDVHREQFDLRRKQGARPMRGGSLGGMFTFRAPRVGVV